MALFCAATRRDSVSCLSFPLLSHIQVLSCEILFVYRFKYPYSCLLLLLLFYSFENFSLQQMVFHWSLSDSKSPQVSRTLLSILADLNNAVVWMISAHPLFFKFPSKFQVFISLFAFLPFYSVFSQSGKVHYSTRSLFFFFFFFFVDYHFVWSSGRDWMIRLYLKIPENFVRLIFKDGFWVLHMPFVCVVKFRFLA